MTNSEKIEYQEDGICLTRCRYRPFTMVGSEFCITKCKYLETHYPDQKVVYCNFKKEINADRDRT